jgi:hypothetical protein
LCLDIYLAVRRRAVARSCCVCQTCFPRALRQTHPFLDSQQLHDIRNKMRVRHGPVARLFPREVLLLFVMEVTPLAAMHSSPAAVLVANGASAPLASRCRSVHAAAPQLTFALSDDKRQLSFGGRQKSVIPVKPEAGGTLREFIETNSDAMVLSSWDAGCVKRCDDGAFLIRVEEFDFVALRIAVELKARCTLDPSTATARLESEGFRILSSRLADQINDKTIDVTVRGALTPTPPQSKLCALSGDVEFVASGALPPVLSRAPEAALRPAARAVSELIIRAAFDRFSKKVPQAYAEWARGRARAKCP